MKRWIYIVIGLLGCANVFAQDSLLLVKRGSVKLPATMTDIVANGQFDLHPMDWRESPISVMFVGTEEGTLDVQTATQFFG